MANRGETQKIGSRGHRLVMYLIEDNGGWIARGQDEDFGVDIEAELDEPEVSGQIIKIQIKSSQSIEITNGMIKVSVEAKYLRLAKNIRYPLILVVADVTEKKAWYLWLQEYLIEQYRTGKKLENFADNTTVYISAENTLTEGLKDKLKRIARWEEETQMLQALIDTTKTAVATGNKDVMMALGKIIAAVDNSFRNFPVEIIVDKLVEINRQPRFFWELGLTSFLLGTLFREHGDRVSLNDILRVVIHGDTFSKTGVRSLGILYDYFPDHTSKFKLPEVFAELGFDELVYYCNLREKYLGIMATDLIMGDFDFTIENMSVNFNNDKLWFFNKWANRGDAVFLDYLEVHE